MTGAAIAIRSLLVVLAASVVSACFTSEETLFGDEDAVAPYQRMAFREDEDDDDVELVRDGRPAVAVFSLRAGERTTGID